MDERSVWVSKPGETVTVIPRHVKSPPIRSSSGAAIMMWCIVSAVIFKLLFSKYFGKRRMTLTIDISRWLPLPNSDSTKLHGSNEIEDCDDAVGMQVVSRRVA